MMASASEEDCMRLPVMYVQSCRMCTARRAKQLAMPTAAQQHWAHLHGACWECVASPGSVRHCLHRRCVLSCSWTWCGLAPWVLSPSPLEPGAAVASAPLHHRCPLRPCWMQSGQPGGGLLLRQTGTFTLAASTTLASRHFRYNTKYQAQCSRRNRVVRT